MFGKNRILFNFLPQPLQTLNVPLEHMQTIYFGCHAISPRDGGATPVAQNVPPAVLTRTELDEDGLGYTSCDATVLFLAALSRQKMGHPDTSSPKLVGNAHRKRMRKLLQRRKLPQELQHDYSDESSNCLTVTCAGVRSPSSTRAQPTRDYVGRPYAT
jgi:hypothetical protein